MRIRNLKNTQEIVENTTYLINNPKEYKGKFNKLFQNDNPIHLEIGMGKGNFIINMAKKYPNTNFIGLELYTNVIARAIKKLNEEDIPNLKLININALELNDIFDHEVSCIYLNFSDPWPKKRNAKRRLTSEVFLKVYDNVFKGDKLIIQKTDNTGLFESSIVSLSNYGYTIEEISLDLHSTDIDNVETEYEHKFASQGVKINYLKARKK